MPSPNQIVATLLVRPSFIGCRERHREKERERAPVTGWRLQVCHVHGSTTNRGQLVPTRGWAVLVVSSERVHYATRDPILASPPYQGAEPLSRGGHVHSQWDQTCRSTQPRTTL